MKGSRAYSLWIFSETQNRPPEAYLRSRGILEAVVKSNQASFASTAAASISATVAPCCHAASINTSIKITSTTTKKKVGEEDIKEHSINTRRRLHAANAIAISISISMVPSSFLSWSS